MQAPLTIIEMWDGHDEWHTFAGTGTPITQIIHHDWDEDRQEIVIEEINRALDLVRDRPGIDPTRLEYWRTKRDEMIATLAEDEA